MAPLTGSNPGPQLAVGESDAAHRAPHTGCDQLAGGWDGGRAELRQVGVAGSRGALDRVRSSGHAAVLRVSSGGSISTAAGQVLGTAPALTIKLNMLIRNNAVTDVCRQPQAPQAVELRRVAAPRRAGGFGCGLVTCV